MKIDQGLKQKISLLAHKHGLSCVVLFGSQATGKTHPHSDVDIGFLSEKDIGYEDRYNIEIDFERIFKHKDIELVDMNRVSPLFMKQIADKGKLLFEDKFGRFISFKVRSFKLYVEAKPIIELKKNLIRSFISKHA